MLYKKQELVLPMNVELIQKCIPHRVPFLLIDRVTQLVPGERIVAHKSISISEPVLQGHFPGNPIYPGFYVLEGMAQASGILGHYTIPGTTGQCLLTEVQAARFRLQIIPGDILEFTIVLKKSRGRFHWFDGEATVDNKTAATATCAICVSLA